MTDEYKGPIEIGARFWWEPDKPHARALVEVTDLHRDGWITTRSLWVGDGPLDRVGLLAINSESRFREAVTPATEADLPDDDGAALIVQAGGRTWVHHPGEVKQWGGDDTPGV